MKCPFCMEDIQEGAIKCKHCGSMLYSSASPPNAPAWINCIEALKTTNTPCLWVSLDYWNLYLFPEKVVAVRCYKGKWGLIAALIGLPMAFVGSLLTMTFGIYFDKSQGESKCQVMKDRKEVSSNKVIEAQWSEVKGVSSSDLCLGNIWLKYQIEIAGKTFYFENAKYEQVKSVFKT